MDKCIELSSYVMSEIKYSIQFYSIILYSWHFRSGGNRGCEVVPVSGGGGGVMEPWSPDPLRQVDATNMTLDPEQVATSTPVIWVGCVCVCAPTQSPTIHIHDASPHCQLHITITTSDGRILSMHRTQHICFTIIERYIPPPPPPITPPQPQSPHPTPISPRPITLTLE